MFLRSSSAEPQSNFTEWNGTIGKHVTATYEVLTSVSNLHKLYITRYRALHAGDVVAGYQHAVLVEVYLVIYSMWRWALQ